MCKQPPCLLLARARLSHTRTSSKYQEPFARLCSRWTLFILEHHYAFLQLLLLIFRLYGTSTPSLFDGRRKLFSLQNVTIEFSRTPVHPGSAAEGVIVERKTSQLLVLEHRQATVINIYSPFSSRFLTNTMDFCFYHPTSFRGRGLV
jgi:hypothetical protein